MSWRRVLKLAVPVGTAATAAVIGASYLNEKPSPLLAVRSAQAYRGTTKPWDQNWDQRDPLSFVNPKKYKAATEADRDELVKKATPTATRHIILVRHGQYHQDHEDLHLTAIGKEQALRAGHRLASAKTKYDRVAISTMRRAKETGDLIVEQLKDKEKLKVIHDPLLEEGYPFYPEPKPTTWWEPDHLFFQENARIEAAFRKYIHRASPEQRHNSHEILVCHGNVIRYFVVRALQFAPEGWLRLSLANGSITKITIRPDGSVSISAVGDSGHLTEDLTTFN